MPQRRQSWDLNTRMRSNKQTNVQALCIPWILAVGLFCIQESGSYLFALTIR